MINEWGTDRLVLYIWTTIWKHQGTCTHWYHLPWKDITKGFWGFSSNTCAAIAFVTIGMTKCCPCSLFFKSANKPESNKGYVYHSQDSSKISTNNNYKIYNLLYTSFLIHFWLQHSLKPVAQNSLPAFDIAAAPTAMVVEKGSKQITCDMAAQIMTMDCKNLILR